MKQIILRTVLFSIILSVFTLAGCLQEEESGGYNNFRFSKEYWGEWIRLDTGDTWYINDKEARVYNVPYPNKISLRKENKNAIEVNDGSKKFYIYASRIKDASFSGRVVKGSGGAIGGSEQGVGSIAVIISNLNNASDRTTVMTDENGNYIAEDIIPMDTYSITVDGKTWNVTPSDGEDVGVMALRDGVNIKVSLSSKDKDRFFYDNTLDEKVLDYYDYSEITIKLNIKNVGNQKVSEGIYAYFTIETPGLRSFNNSNYLQPGQRVPLGGLKPEYYFDIPLRFIGEYIPGESDIKRISFTIVDPETEITWKDYASITVSTPVQVYICSQDFIKGVVIAPFKKAYYVGDGRFVPGGDWNSAPYILLPWRSDDYLLVLASAGQNTTYSLGVGIEPGKQWGLLGDKNIYKPHDTEETATPIGMYEQKMAFLFRSDIDYWRINMGNAKP